MKQYQKTKKSCGKQASNLLLKMRFIFLFMRYLKKMALKLSIIGVYFQLGVTPIENMNLNFTQ